MTNLTAPAAIRGRLVGKSAAIAARNIARRETAPRHRGLIGSRVDRNEPVDHTDRILSALMHADTLRSGAQHEQP